MKSHLIVIIVILLTIASGIGSIITEFNQALGRFLILLGVVITIYQIIANEIRNNTLTKMLGCSKYHFGVIGSGKCLSKNL